MTLFLWTTLLATCAGLMWALAALDRLIDLGPAGGVILRAKESSLRSGLNRNRLFVQWFFRTPAWAGEFRNTRSLLRRFRIGSAVAFAGFISFSAGAFLHI